MLSFPQEVFEIFCISSETVFFKQVQHFYSALYFVLFWRLCWGSLYFLVTLQVYIYFLWNLYNFSSCNVINNFIGLSTIGICVTFEQLFLVVYGALGLNIFVLLWKALQESIAISFMPCVDFGKLWPTLHILAGKHSRESHLIYSPKWFWLVVSTECAICQSRKLFPV